MTNRVQKTIIKNLVREHQNAQTRAAQMTLKELPTQAEKDEAKRIFSALHINYTDEKIKMYKDEAKIFVNAIRTIAEKEGNLENLESYLSMHFGAWLNKYANTPEGIAAEMRDFSEMDI